MLVIPVHNVVLTPDSVVYFGLDQLKQSAGSKGYTVNEKVVMIVTKKSEKFSDLTEESFYPIGVSGYISDINNQGYAAIRTQYRVNLEEVGINPDRTIDLTISRRNDIDDLDPDIEAEKLKDILEEARRVLDEDHYGLKKVKERIIQQIAVMNLKKKQSGSILLFVGAPGTGKTSIGKSIARALGREYARVSLGGIEPFSRL